MHSNIHCRLEALNADARLPDITVWGPDTFTIARGSQICLLISFSKNPIPKKCYFRVKEYSHLFFTEPWHKCALIFRFIMKFTWCSFLHKWNEYWPAWLPIDNKIILTWRNIWRYCQGKLDMMSVLFYKLPILVLTLTLIFFSTAWKKEEGRWWSTLLSGYHTIVDSIKLLAKNIRDEDI